MTVLAHQLDRTLVIGAPPALVFRYFTDSDRWAAWWGAGSTIDARPGGRVYIRYPGNVEAVGEVIDVSPPSLLRAGARSCGWCGIANAPRARSTAPCPTSRSGRSRSSCAR